MFVCVRVCVCVALCLCRSAMPILLRAPPPLLWLYKRHFNTRQGLRGNADLPEDLSTSGAVVLRFETEAGDDTVAVADELLPFGTGVRLQRISGSPAPGEGVKGVEGEVVVCGVIWCGINHVPKDTRFFHETLTTTHSLTLTLTHTHTHSLSHTHTHTHTHAHTHTHKRTHRAVRRDGHGYAVLDLQHESEAGHSSQRATQRTHLHVVGRVCNEENASALGNGLYASLEHDGAGGQPVVLSVHNALRCSGNNKMPVLE